MRNERRVHCRFCFLAVHRPQEMRRLPVFTDKLLIRACGTPKFKTAVIRLAPEHNPSLWQFIPILPGLNRRVRAALETYPPAANLWQGIPWIMRFLCLCDSACSKQNCNTASRTRKKLSSSHSHLLSSMIPAHTSSIVLSHESSQKYLGTIHAQAVAAPSPRQSAMNSGRQSGQSAMCAHNCPASSWTRIFPS